MADLEAIPNFFQPDALKASFAAGQKREEAYSVGQANSEDQSVALKLGPYANLAQALQTVGDDANSRIVLHDADGTDRNLYSWNVEKQGWEILL